jgi:hypothetical protein
LPHTRLIVGQPDAASLRHSARPLVQMFAPLGFASADDLVRRGYDLQPEEVRLAVEWLKLNPPNEPMPLDVVLGKHGRPKKGEEKGCNARLKYGTKAHWLARFKRDQRGTAAMLDELRRDERE